MRRHAALLLTILALFVMLAMPVVAQDDATVAPAEPSAAEATAEDALPPLPTAIPSSDGPVVQAVFYFSPTCGHCEFVINEILPGLFAENGGEYVVTFDESVLPEQPAFYLMSNGHLQMMLIDVSTTDGSAVFKADSVRLGMDRAGVPRVDFDEDLYLVGSGDIPDQFPGIVEAGLAGDGLAWPAVPGIDSAVQYFISEGSVLAAGVEGTPEPTEAPAEATDEPAAASEVPAEASAAPVEPAAVLPIGGDSESVLDKIGNDPVGNGISIIVLVALIISAVAAPYLAVRGSLPTFPSWLVIVLAIVGIGVSAYLANIETSGDEAVCGPVGDCNAVQESEYAELFGIPIGVLGVIGYLAVGGLWVISRLAKGSLADWSLVLLGAGAFLGTLFSIYLTFLEPFVIGATCMWCITSALVMGALLWITVGPGWAALERIRGNGPAEGAPSGS